MKYIPLNYKSSQMSRKYYAFWKKENANQVIEEFAKILEKAFK